MWRPPDWGKIKKFNYHVEIDEEVFEAGADAILEALRATKSLPEIKAILWSKFGDMPSAGIWPNHEKGG